jgi:hypothetical protein
VAVAAELPTIVEHERHPLARRQRLEYDEQGQADRIGLFRGRLGVRIDPAHHRVGHVRLERLLAARLASPQEVEADPADHGREPRLEVLHLADVRAGQSQPRLLDGVVGLGHRAQHPVGHRAQVGALLLELSGQLLLVRHLSGSSLVVRLLDDEPRSTNMTGDRSCKHG